MSKCGTSASRSGWAPIRLPGDSGRTFDHWDRFFLPSIAQIEYAVDGWFRIVNSIVHLPMSGSGPAPGSSSGSGAGLPAPLVRAAVRLQGKRILRQDADGLARQTERTRSLGGERYTSTELDLLGTAIWRLLRHAERAEHPDSGDASPIAISERTVMFEA